jgi:hypothetical protein
MNVLLHGGACILILCAQIYAQAEGTLDVRTDPEGIEVWLDDKYIGDAPVLDKKLKAGRYTLKLVDPVQHASTVEEIFVQAGEKTVIEKTIKSKFGSLRVDSDPTGADVSIATPLGKTPVANDFMNPGKYRVELRYPGRRYETAVQEVVIPRGETVNISKTLVRKSPLDMKAFVRLALGAGAIGCMVWSVHEEGVNKENLVKSQNPGSDRRACLDARNAAIAWRDVGIVVGCLCVVGFEIVAFF